MPNPGMAPTIGDSSEINGLLMVRMDEPSWAMLAELDYRSYLHFNRFTSRGADSEREPLTMEETSSYLQIDMDAPSTLTGAKEKKK